MTLLGASLLACLSCTGQKDAETPPVAAADASAELKDWPALESRFAKDPAIEARVAEILASMTLEQKVGQMVQPEIKSITPEEVRQYYIGSVLNGGGSWPAKNKHASVQDWVALADAYYDSSMGTDAKIPVPVIWGTDAVHGHSNVYGATKAFVRQFSLGLRSDLSKHGVRVTSIEPGLSESEFTLVRTGGDKAAYDALYRGANALQPEDIAETIFWLMSQPAHLNINSLEIMPVSQTWAGFAVHRE